MQLQIFVFLNLYFSFIKTMPVNTEVYKLAHFQWD